MNKLKTNKKAVALSMALAAGLLLPMGMNAQERGMLGHGKTAETPSQSLFGRDRSTSSNGLSLQGFGENQNGLSLQNFGEQQSPLGSGWLVLVTAGLGYAAMKTRKSKKQTKSLK